MTPDQINAKIAELCGWKKIPLPKSRNWGESAGPDKQWWYPHQLPNYHGSLDAMHEAEKALTVAQRITYANQIGVVMSGGAVRRAIPDWWYIHEATAAQRAEAFLRTLSLLG